MCLHGRSTNAHRLHEAPTQRSPSPSTRLALAAPMHGLGLVIVLFKGLDSLVGPMVKPMMVDAGYSLSTIGYIQGRRSAAALVGAVIGGIGVQYLGRTRSLIWFGALQVCAVGP